MLKTKKILINEKNYKDLKNYFTRYVDKKLIKMLSLHCYELIGNSEKHEGKNI